MHRKRIKLTVIVIAAVFLSSCSVFRKAGGVSERLFKSIDTGKYLGELEKKNITSGGFRIDKVRVTMDLQGDTKRFSGNLKYDNRGNILFSVRTFAGIEVARAFLNDSVIVVVDRINREYSTGKTENLLRKYGLKWDDVKMIFGGMSGERSPSKTAKCVNGEAVITIEDEYRNKNIIVDCASRKLIRIEAGDLGGNTVQIKFGDYISVEKKDIPSRVKVSSGEYILDLGFERIKMYDGKLDIPVKPGSYTRGLI